MNGQDHSLCGPRIGNLGQGHTFGHVVCAGELLSSTILKFEVKVLMVLRDPLTLTDTNAVKNPLKMMVAASQTHLNWGKILSVRNDWPQIAPKATGTGTAMEKKFDRRLVNSTALRLFKEHGFDNVKVSEICERCDITKPTFYHYVRSKDDLLVSYYESVIDQLNGRLAAMAPSTDSWGQILACFNLLVDESERMGSDLLGRMLIINLQKDRHSFDRRASLTESMVAIIRRGQASGQIGNRSGANALYETSAYLFQGYELLWCVRAGQMDWRSKLFASLEALLQIS